jgi:lipopolysaccharide export system permease protein
MIIRTIDRHLMGQIAFASIVAIVIFSFPVVLISASVQLPNEALFSSLAWPALASIGPMILYNTMPLLVPIAIVWCYANFATNGTLVTMYMTGRSSLSVRAPALAVAIAAMAVCYALSCWIAPRTAGRLQDLMMSLAHDINPVLLRDGRFNAIDDGRQVIFFRQRIDDTTIADVFIRQNPGTDDERVYRARQGVFWRSADNAQRALVLLDGTVQFFNGGKANMKVTAFDRVELPLTEFVAGRSTHSWTLVEELGPLAFLQDRLDAFKHPVEGRNWTREALKRFGVPALALVHTLLGLALLAVWGTMSGREQEPTGIVVAIVSVLHMAVIGTAEHAWIGAFAALIIGELAIAIALMAARSKRAATTTETAYARAAGAPAGVLVDEPMRWPARAPDTELRPVMDRYRRDPATNPLAIADSGARLMTKKIA